MPLISRIQFSNFMNHRRVEPWRPDWVYETLVLNCQNTAFYCPNGRGKSTILELALGLLVWDSSILAQLRERHFAPKNSRYSTHLRLEMMIQTETAASNYSIFEPGTAGAFGRSPMIFGIYGNKGDAKINLYAYEGYLEDCPIGESNGMNRILLENNQFQDKFSKAKGIFPRSQREMSQHAWRSHVGTFCNMASLRQQLAYQKKQGGEGSKSYFNITAVKGESYAATLFYEYIAPELLVDLLRGKGKEDEYSLEDTLYEMVSKIVQAQHDIAVKKKSVESIGRTTNALSELTKMADRMIEARDTYMGFHNDLMIEKSVLHDLLIARPIPGVPRSPDENTGDMAKYLVFQSNNWYLPDYAIARFTDEESKIVNQRADRKSIRLERWKIRQLLEITCDLAPSCLSGGRPNRLYSMTNAIELLRNTTNFTQLWDQQSAIAEVEKAFVWANARASTNPARIQARSLDQSIKDTKRILQKLDEDLTTIRQQRSELNERLSCISGQRKALQDMRESELFSSGELLYPLATNRKIGTRLNEVDQKVIDGELRKNKWEDTYNAWTEFVNENGFDMDAKSLANDLEVQKNAAEQAKNEIDQKEKETRVDLHPVEELVSKKRAFFEKAERKWKEIEEVLPDAQKFEMHFPGESSKDLESKVIREFEKASNKKRSGLEELTRLKNRYSLLDKFKKHFPNEDPNQWLNDRTQEKNALVIQENDLSKKFIFLEQQRKGLEKSVIVAGKIAQEVEGIIGQDCRALYQVVNEMDLPMDHRAMVLTHFSALLFAPVFETVKLSAAAAQKLAHNRVESPVFVRSELEDFCRNAQSRITVKNNSAYSFLVGVKTQPMDCLIDPELVSREKATLDALISEAEAEIKEISQHIDALSENHPDTKLARECVKVLEENIEGRISSLQLSLAALDKDLPILEARQSEESRKIIQAHARLTFLLNGQTVGDLKNDFDLLKKDYNNLLKKQQDLLKKMKSIQTEHSRVYEQYSEAQSFTAKIDQYRKIAALIEGEHHLFVESWPDQHAYLIKEKYTLTLKNKFQFKEAAEYLKHDENYILRMEQSLEDLKDKEKINIPNKKKEKSDHLETLEQARNQLDEHIYSADQLIIRLIGEYKKLYHYLPDTDVVPERVFANHSVYMEAEKLRLPCNSIQEQIERMQDAADNIQHFNAEAKHSELRNSQKTLNRSQAEFNEQVEKIAKDTQFTFSEPVREELLQSKTEVNRVYHLHRVYEGNYKSELETNQLAERIIADDRTKLASDIQKFLVRLPNNFNLLQKTLRADANDPNSAGFNVSATLNITESEIIINQIIFDIEHFEKLKSEAFDQGKSLAEFSDNKIKAKIRNTFHRSMFSKPNVKLHFPAICARPTTMEKRMASSGQGVAIILLWLIKMADFVSKRETNRELMSAAKRRERQSRTETFVFIDGAFSHVSDGNLLSQAMSSLKKIYGVFQLIITGHNMSYHNNYDYFPSYVVARETSEDFVYIKDNKPIAPERVGSHNDAMQTMAIHRSVHKSLLESDSGPT